MDRTSRLGAFICGIALIAVWIYTTPPPKPKTATPAHATSVAPATVPAKPMSPAAQVPNLIEPRNPQPTPPAPAVPEVTSIIENEAIKVTLTSNGATIKQIELKEYRDGAGHVILNDNSRSNVLELGGWAGATNFQVKESTRDGVVYTAELPGGVKWERSYAFSKDHDTETGMSGYLRVLFNKVARHLGKPETVPLVYNLDIKDSLTNTGTTDVTLPAYSLSVGRAQPLLVNKHYQTISDQYLGSGWYTQRFHITTVNDFNPSYVPLLGIKLHDGKDSFTSTSVDDAPLRWLGVENQFFTVLLTPEGDRTIQHAMFQCFNRRDAEGYVLSTRDPSARDEEGYLLPGLEPDIEAAAYFPALSLPVDKTVDLHYGLYAGPKEFNRLDALGADQGALMNYDGVLPFSLLIVPMLTILKFWHLIFHDYGVSIILLTLMIKAITWPLQSIANRSGKRMQALAPKLKEIQAKYKDQPEKLQTETFAMYRDYGVNPFGGCLPALVQMPVFFSLYFMLMNAVELRGQSFMWVRDLTQPDALITFQLPFILPLIGGHFSLNLLPILVTALTVVMMKMTPQIGDPQQAKIAQWMPLVFLFIFYNFAAALSLYYVVNNFVSIIQIYRNLKKPMPVLERKPRKKAA